MSLTYVGLTLDEYFALDLDAYFALPVSIDDVIQEFPGSLIYGSAIANGGIHLNNDLQYVTNRDRAILVDVETIITLFSHGSLDYKNYRR